MVLCQAGALPLGEVTAGAGPRKSPVPTAETGLGPSPPPRLLGRPRRGTDGDLGVDGQAGCLAPGASLGRVSEVGVEGRASLGWGRIGTDPGPGPSQASRGPEHQFSGRRVWGARGSQKPVFRTPARGCVPEGGQFCKTDDPVSTSSWDWGREGELLQAERDFPASVDHVRTLTRTGGLRRGGGLQRERCGAWVLGGPAQAPCWHCGCVSRKRRTYTACVFLGEMGSMLEVCF